MVYLYNFFQTRFGCFHHTNLLVLSLSALDLSLSVNTGKETGLVLPPSCAKILLWLFIQVNLRNTKLPLSSPPNNKTKVQYSWFCFSYQSADGWTDVCPDARHRHNIWFHVRLYHSFNVLIPHRRYGYVPWKVIYLFVQIVKSRILASLFK